MGVDKKSLAHEIDHVKFSAVDIQYKRWKWRKDGSPFPLLIRLVSLIYTAQLSEPIQIRQCHNQREEANCIQCNFSIFSHVVRRV
jgi:hypothetical protein